MKKKTKSPKEIKKFYAFGNYKPNKNAVPVEFCGVKYLSKAQCMALEGLTRKELEMYLKGDASFKVVKLVDNEVSTSAEVYFDELL